MLDALTSWCGTYLLHSTVALLAAWWLMRRGRRSVLDQELLLRTALIGSLITATAQTWWGSPAWSVPSPWPAQVAERPSDEERAERQARRRAERLEARRTRDVEDARDDTDRTKTPDAGRPPISPSRDTEGSPARNAGRPRNGQVTTGAVVSDRSPSDALRRREGTHGGSPLASNGAAPPMDPTDPSTRTDETSITTLKSEDDHTAPTWLATIASSSDDATTWLRTLLPKLWALGALLVGGWTLRSVLGVRRVLGSALRAPDSLASRTLNALRYQAGIHRPIELWITPRSTEPASVGLFRLRITVPPAALELLERNEGHALLAHEVAHLRRGDSWWQLIHLGLKTLACLQPLNLWAIRRLDRLAERACDDWAADATGRPLDLASCLTEVAGWTVEEQTPLSASALTGTRSELTQRVHRLLSRPDERRWSGRTRLALVTCAVMALALMPGVSRRATAEPMDAGVAMTPVAIEPAPAQPKVERRRALKDVDVDSLDDTQLWRLARRELRILSARIRSLRQEAEKRAVSSDLQTVLDALKVREQSLEQWIDHLRPRMANEGGRRRSDDGADVPRSRSERGSSDS